MDKKILAIIVAAIIVVAGVAVYFVFHKDKDDSLNIVGRVNSEGSGIILKAGEERSDYITEYVIEPGLGAKYIYNESAGIWYVFNASNWGGKIFCTPGAATIQHVQLGQLANLMGLKYVSYTENTALSSDTLYYVAGVPSYADFENKLKSAPDAMVGFIIWEAQYSVGLQKGCVSLAMTNDLFDGHTCCIIAARHAFLNDNAQAMSAFLDVFVKSTKRINDALDAGSGSDYDALISIAKNRVAMPDSLTDAQKEAAIKSSLLNVTYINYDDTNGGLNNLRKDIAELAEALVTSNQISKTPSDLGFASYSALAEKFVDDSYMKDAVKGVTLESKKTISVAVIAGDIHQIAIWFALDTGMFEAANISLDIASQGNGPAVYTVLANGEADIGFLGAPPMTIRSMNGENITA